MRVEVRVHITQLNQTQRTFAKEEFAEMNMSFEQETLGEVLSITDLTRGVTTGGGRIPPIGKALARPAMRPSPSGNERYSPCV